MILLALVAVALATYYTGPAGKESLERRRATLDEPKVTVLYLPSAGCRGPISNG